MCRFAGRCKCSFRTRIALRKVQKDLIRFDGAFCVKQDGGSTDVLNGASADKSGMLRNSNEVDTDHIGLVADKQGVFVMVLLMV